MYRLTLISYYLKAVEVHIEDFRAVTAAELSGI